jgi:hypothetical protein
MGRSKNRRGKKRRQQLDRQQQEKRDLAQAAARAKVNQEIMREAPLGVPSASTIRKRAVEPYIAVAGEAEMWARHLGTPLVSGEEAVVVKSQPTAATTTTRTGANCAVAASPRRSRAARPNTAPAWAASAGLSSAPSPGSVTSSGCSSATTAGTRSTKPSLPSAASCLLQETSTVMLNR